MIKVIRRHQKKFLTGLTIFSMVAFLVNRGSSGQGSGADPLYATINGKKVYVSDMAQAHAELQALTHTVRFNMQGRSFTMLDFTFPPEIAATIASKPEWFLMLRDEADAANIQVNVDEVKTMLVNDAKLDANSEDFDIAVQATVDLQKIKARYQQLSNSIKVSKPMRDGYLAKFGETLQMNLVQLNASDFLSKVAPPTTQQVQDQFTKYAASTPHVPVADTNPFGYGYKLPLRAKLQYLRVSVDKVGAAVVATKTPYEWDVAARKYYLNSPDEFSIKPVTTGPNSAASTAPSTQPVIPQTYDQAHDHVLATIRTPLIESLADQVRGYVSATLSSDYQTYLKFVTANAGGAEPDSSLGVRYSSFTYLSKLIDTVKDRFKVEITASETPDYSTVQIGDLPSVGSPQLVKFVEAQALAYLDKQDKKDPTAPAVLMRPSPPLAESIDKTTIAGIVFARLSEVLPSQPATDLASIQSQVETDVRYTAAYKLAQDQAKFLQLSAKAGGLVPAALASGRSIIPIQGDNAISFDSNDVKGVTPPLGDSATSFMTQAFSVLGTYDPKTNPHPAQIIELPEQGRLFVAQVTDLNTIWNAETYYSIVMESAGRVTSQDDLKLSDGWFNYDAVAKRTGFKLSK